MDRTEAVMRIRDKELPQAFTARFTPDDFRYFRLAMHPTKRKETREITKKILFYLNKRDIVTNLEIQDDLHLVEATVLKRLNVLLAFKLLKREFNRYYIVTPRLKELVRLYINHL